MADFGLVLLALVVGQFVLAERVVALTVVVLLVVAYIAFAELVAAVVSTALVVAELAVERRVWLAAVLDSSQASHCLSAQACSRLASRASTFSAKRFPNADACCWHCGS